MRKTMILGAAIAALLISAIPADAGCLSGLFGGRRAARQQAMAASAGACSSGYSSFASYSDAGSCYSAQYAASAACPTGNCPQTAAYYSASAPCPTGNCPQYATAAPVQRAIQYVYTQAPAPAPTIVSTAQTGNCDANGDGRCDHCGMACNGATLPQAPPTPPPAPLSRRTTKATIVAIKPPDPIAPPIAYIPPAKTIIPAETMIAFR